MENFEGPPEPKLIDRMNAVNSKLERYQKNDEEIMARIKQITDTFADWFNELEEDDQEEVKERLIFNGIFDSQIQKKLIIDLNHYFSNKDYGEKYWEDKVRMDEKIESIIKASGATPRDLIAIVIFCFKEGDSFENLSISSVALKILKNMRSPELDRIVFEELGENFFEESLTTPDIWHGNYNALVASNLFCIVHDKNFLLKTFASFLQKAKQEKELIPKHSGLKGCMITMSMSDIVETIIEQYLEKLSEKDLRMLLEGLEEFGEVETPSIDTALINKIKPQLERKQHANSLN